MTTTTDFVPENLDEIVAKAGPRTIVFADGSTFDYVHGVRMNGAPAAVNGRVNTTIVKPFKIFRDGLLSALPWLTAALVVAFFVIFALVGIRAAHTSAAIRDGTNNSGRVEVVSQDSRSVIVKDSNTGNLYKCDVNTVEDNGAHEALVFCSPGSPASFTINLDSNDH